VKRERERERESERERERWGGFKDRKAKVGKMVGGFCICVYRWRREGPQQAGKLGLQWRKPERETVKEKQK
jgi:hypothetical protein